VLQKIVSLQGELAMVFLKWEHLSLHLLHLSLHFALYSRAYHSVRFLQFVLYFISQHINVLLIWKGFSCTLCFVLDPYRCAGGPKWVFGIAHEFVLQRIVSLQGESL